MKGIGSCSRRTVRGRQNFQFAKVTPPLGPNIYVSSNDLHWFIHLWPKVYLKKPNSIIGDLVCSKTENYRSTPINLEKTSHNVYLHLTNFLSPNHQFCCGSGSSSVSLFLLLKTIFGSVFALKNGVWKKSTKKIVHVGTVFKTK